MTPLYGSASTVKGCWQVWPRNERQIHPISDIKIKPVLCCIGHIQVEICPLRCLPRSSYRNFFFPGKI
ncbi:hypothetical protein Pdw03_0739 [Penicillium digitatum]|uniref:Uncharacterized protein n=1 Tax=Penicillium digitatum TaxID=36651 RepID=A0A7T7BN28_PENDI|nr:hypothetical protein Pdw03_0739 [Penicillium digitatum]